ncbi:uncharacterized protein B0H18DRAFT_403413 [Fomitopsis serialis]|uniref:uncharacterized protein n=1 Tax=Fomitopsis serialis TaxID=139415 RepID=UPI0020087CC5|nr:uncharacterized protein B0H18DRAFT_403413 [Neoantrodia serialis]KAH9924810.1 hypothetical protein B0H18DRAFT_403413 [Neoantrodia serialis]
MNDGQMRRFDAVIFPADEQPPRLISLYVSPLAVPIQNASEPYRCGYVPHPEMYFDHVAPGLGPRSWRFEPIKKLDGMLIDFPAPYLAFYPIVSSDGMVFPINKCMYEIRGKKIRSPNVWRGDIVVAKYHSEYVALMDATMADFPLLRNWFSKKPGPGF